MRKRGRQNSPSPLLNKWDYVYDARNRKVQELEPAVLDADPASATYQQTTRPTMAWQYDAGGRVVAAIDARGAETDTVYDPANRVTQVLQPAVSLGGNSVRPTSQTSYDLDGNVLSVTDPNGHTTTNSYDALNRLITSTDAAGYVVTNGYDAVGNKTSVEDGDHDTTTFAYDGLNRLTTTTDAAGAATTFSYDALVKTARTDALGRVTQYGYDARERLQTVAYVGAPAGVSGRAYAYDAVGNLLSVTESATPAANVVYQYDALNRVTGETSNGLTHNYIYDPAGNRLTTAYGGTGRTLTSSYDALNRAGIFSRGFWRASAPETCSPWPRSSASPGRAVPLGEFSPNPNRTNPD